MRNCVYVYTVTGIFYWLIDYFKCFASRTFEAMYASTVYPHVAGEVYDCTKKPAFIGCPHVVNAGA